MKLTEHGGKSAAMTGESMAFAVRAPYSVISEVVVKNAFTSIVKFRCVAGVLLETDRDWGAMDGWCN